MRASQRRSIRSGGGFVALLRALAFGSLAFGTFACSGSTPMDMWITKDPDAGADFDAPMREVSANGGTGGAGGEGGSGGTGGDTGSAGTTGSGGGGQAGLGGQAGQGGDTGGANAGGTGGNS